jgi:hypothetical protein
MTMTEYNTYEYVLFIKEYGDWKFYGTFATAGGAKHWVEKNKPNSIYDIEMRLRFD